MLIGFLRLVAMCIVKSKLPANYLVNYYLYCNIVNLFSKDCPIYINLQIVLAPELCSFGLTQKTPWYFSKKHAVELSIPAVIAFEICPRTVQRKVKSRYVTFRIEN